MSELTSTEKTSLRKRGRPKGSKYKPKTAAPVPVSSEAIPTPIRLVLTPEGLPNLPEGKIVGRPMGKKNSGPRKSRTFNSKKSEVIIEEEDVQILPADSPSLLSE